MPEVESIWARLGLKVDKKSFDKGDELISGIKTAVAAWAGLKGIEAISGLVGSTVELGGHLDDLSQKTGLSAEALQEYAFAAKLSGGDLDQFAGGVTKLNRSLYEATHTGTGPAADSLRALGINFQGAAFKSLTLDDKIMEIADHISDIKDPAKKTALAMDLFGKSGADLIPVLNNGKDGLKELRDSFKEFELSNQAVSALDNLGDSFDTVKAKVTGLKNQAVASLAPVLQGLVDRVSDWIAANKELIATFITGAVSALTVVIDGLAAAIGFVVDVIQFFIEHSELGKSVLTALALVAGYFGVVMAAAWAAAAIGPLLLIAGITAIVLAIRYLIKHWDEVKKVMAKVWENTVKDLRRAWDKIKDIGESIRDFFTKDIPDAINEAWDAVGNKIKEVWDDVKMWIKNGLIDLENDLLNNKALVALMKFSGQGATIDLIEGLKKSGALKTDKDGNILHVDKDGNQVDPTAPAANAPARPVDPGAHASLDIKSTLNLDVSGANGDPKAISDEIGKSVQKHFDNILLDTQGVVG